MITGVLMGRLCNQMFQIAAVVSHAFDNKFQCTFPRAVLGGTPTKEESDIYAKTIFRKVPYTSDFSFVTQRYQETGFNYAQLPALDSVIYEGYFQSHKYFEHNRDIILDLFSPADEIENYILEKYAYFLDRDDTVSVSIRRGDYTTERYINHHGLLPRDYYDRAMDHFPKTHTFLFFSDDIEWCKQEFGEQENFLFIEDEIDVVDFYLIGKMRHNIIANSTFPWWAAWMSQVPDKTVIAPKQWFGPANAHLDISDLYPDSWIQL